MQVSYRPVGAVLESNQGFLADCNLIIIVLVWAWSGEGWVEKGEGSARNSRILPIIASEECPFAAHIFYYYFERE